MLQFSFLQRFAWKYIPSRQNLVTNFSVSWALIALSIFPAVSTKIKILDYSRNNWWNNFSFFTLQLWKSRKSFWVSIAKVNQFFLIMLFSNQNIELRTKCLAFATLKAAVCNAMKLCTKSTKRKQFVLIIEISCSTVAFSNFLMLLIISVFF